MIRADPKIYFRAVGVDLASISEQQPAIWILPRSHSTERAPLKLAARMWTLCQDHFFARNKLMLRNICCQMPSPRSPRTALYRIFSRGLFRNARSPQELSGRLGFGRSRICSQSSFQPLSDPFSTKIDFDGAAFLGKIARRDISRLISVRASSRPTAKELEDPRPVPRDGMSAIEVISRPPEILSFLSASRTTRCSIWSTAWM